MQPVRLLGKSAAIASSVALLAGFVAFRAGALNAWLTPARPPAVRLFYPSDRDVGLREEQRRELSLNAHEQTLAVDEIVAVEVSAEPVAQTIDALLPGSKGGVFHWAVQTDPAETATVASQERHAAPIRTFPAGSSARARRGTAVMAGSKSIVITPRADHTVNIVPVRSAATIRERWNTASIQPEPEGVLPVISGSKSGVIDWTAPDGTNFFRQNAPAGWDWLFHSTAAEAAPQK